MFDCECNLRKQQTGSLHVMTESVTENAWVFIFTAAHKLYTSDVFIVVYQGCGILPFNQNNLEPIPPMHQQAKFSRFSVQYQSWNQCHGDDESGF